ncbi:aspartate/glutamate racemase family protein [Brucella pituitosa]|uniref:aspartate/glutamate racemase family protein n=1 Tax=Brucella pituitosa TaxID=571256 RepID=UPI000C272816|nr:aspartate/glutamate racemase family protein [Brucella pituitosa]MCK4205656.1 aspartate/glutamate racemase family protein [Brucella pituitosa]PJO48711.1 Asp/Glu/hydantoin racemase [Brucella pituitosa]PRA86441.1 Asp/Glu/hydantoin racemase [Ochrobactrum sp. MYb29]
MDILVVNPNTTASMTRKIGEAARSVAATDTNIIAVNPKDGPPSIEGYFDEVFAIPGMIGEMQKHSSADACIIACFDDTGLDAARCASTMPVIGIGEAAFHMASLISGKFSVVTTLSRSVPAIEHNLVRYGLATRCARVRASDVAVLELEIPGSDARKRISEEIARAIRDDHAEAIVLGCAGMADLAASLSQEHGLPVIDGVTAAVKLCEGLVSLGLKTSKRGGYLPPRTKIFEGMFEPYSPGR